MCYLWSCVCWLSVHTGLRLYTKKSVEPKNTTYHGQVRSGRTAERPAGVRQGLVPRERFAQITTFEFSLQGIEKTSSQYFSGSRNKQIPLKSSEEQNQWLTIIGLKLVYEQDEKCSLFLTADG